MHRTSQQDVLVMKINIFRLIHYQNTVGSVEDRISIYEGVAKRNDSG